jgi:hypothetical protein
MSHSTSNSNLDNDPFPVFTPVNSKFFLILDKKSFNFI